MVYKKYIKRGDKVFGPYYYSNYRKGDKVKTRYIGVREKYQNEVKKRKLFAIAAILLVIVALFFFLKPSIMGFTSSVIKPAFTLSPIQSHPKIGENWTVELDTEGTADLTIKAVNGTTWSNENEDNDLKFLEVRCGSKTLDYEWIDNSVFVENYECDETGYEISKVLIAGKHTLKFKFGDYAEYAYNSPGAPNVTITSPQNTTYTTASIDLNWTYNETLNWCAYSLNGAANDTSICPTKWWSNSDIVSDLGDIGSGSAPAVFNMSGTLYLISGERYGYFYGFNWTGSAWQSDSHINSSLGDIGGYSKPEVFNMSGTWYMIAGENDGVFNGYNWTGSAWQNDSHIVSGLGNLGYYTNPTVFEMGGTLYLISGEQGGVFYGFNWTGSVWQSDSHINSSLGDIGSNSAPEVFEKDGTWYLISGESDGVFYGFNWTGSAWQSDSHINSSLGDVGSSSTPEVFNMDGTLYLIAGEYGGVFNGYDWGFKSINITITAQEGGNSITIWANDTAGNMGSDTVYFTVTAVYWDTAEECNINDTRSYSNEGIIATCDVVINGTTGGVLNFQNVTFYMNETSNYEYSFTVEAGATLNTNDSTQFLDYNEAGYYYYMYFEGNSSLNDTTFYYRTLPRFRNSSVNDLSGTTINSSTVLFYGSSNNTITNSTITYNHYFYGSSNNTITNSTFSTCSIADFEGNSTNTITDSTISGASNFEESSTSTITNSEIPSGCGNDLIFRDTSNNTITNSDILATWKWFKGSSVNTITNSTFAYNTYFGENSSTTAKNSSFYYFIIYSETSSNLTIEDLARSSSVTNYFNSTTTTYEVNLTNVDITNLGVRLTSNSINTIINVTFNYESYIHGTSRNTIINSTFQDWVRISGSSNNTITNTNFTGSHVRFYDTPNTTFNKPYSSITAIRIGYFAAGAKPEIHGYLNLTSFYLTWITGTYCNRYFPIYVYEEGTSNPVDNANVTIMQNGTTYTTSGLTNASGYVELNITFDDETGWNLYNFTLFVNDVDKGNITFLNDTSPDGIILYEVYPPNVTLSSPADDSTDTDGDVIFQCNVTDNLKLINISLYTNSTGTWRMNQTTNFTEWHTPTAIYDKCGEVGYAPATNMIDDNTSSYWRHDTAENHSIAFDMGQTYNITKVRVYHIQYMSSDPPDFIYVSDDPNNWGSSVGASSGVNYYSDPDGWDEIDITDKSGRYINITSNGTDLYWYEFDAYGFPITPTSYNASFNVTGLSDGSYKWNCLAYDNDSNSDWGDADWTFNVSTDPISTLISPANASWSNGTTTFTCNGSDGTALSGITLYIWNSTAPYLTNATSASGTSEQASWNYTLSEDNYTWNCLVNDTENNEDWDINRTLYVDTSYPTISVTFPANNSNLSLTWINITGTASDTNNDTIYVNDTRFGSNQGTYQNWNFTNASITDGTYSILITANDSANNTNSTNIIFTIDTTAPNITNMTISPSIAADIDPNVNITVTVNITDATAGVDTVLLQYRNYSVSTFANVTMSSAGGNLYNASFNASINGTWHYQVWANDSAGNSINNTPNSTDVQYECTWSINNTIDDQTLGTLESTSVIGNITINNTGDAGYHTASCSLNFFVKHNLASGRISFTSSVFTLAAKATREVNVTATFSDVATSEDLVITITELNTITSPSSRTVNTTLTSYAGGAYLNVVINASPSAVNQTDAFNFTLSAYVENIGNESASNVTLNWTLPTGWGNISGSLNLNVSVLNCSDPTISPSSGCDTNPSLNTLVNVIVATVSNPNTASIGAVTIWANSSSADKVNSSCVSNCSYVNASDSVIATVSCYAVSDGVCPTSGTCSYDSTASNYDPDCTAPAAETITTGGGGVGAPPAAIVSEATYELIRGKDENFSLEVKNPFKEAWLKDIKMKVAGFLSQYISVEPPTLDEIPPNSSFNFTIRIVAPAYFVVGEHNLTFTIDSVKELGVMRTARVEKRYITLVIHELGREDAAQLIALSKDYIEKMRALELNTKGVRSLLEQSQEALEKGDYERVQELCVEIEGIATAALESHDIIIEMEKKIKDAERSGVKVEGTRRMLGLAKAASDRGDYALALERAKDAEVTFALETKGEFNLLYFIAQNTLEVFFGTLIILALLTTLFFRVKLSVINRSLTGLHEEEGILLGLMKTIQHECFTEKRLSMGEYFQSMLQYEDKLSKTIQRIVTLESAKANIFKFKGAKLELERRRLLDLMKETQHLYMKEKKLDTRVYNRRMHSYSTRLSEIEEELATHEAERALRRDKLRRFLRFVAFVKTLKVVKQKRAKRLVEKGKKKALIEKLRKEKEKARRKELLEKLKQKKVEELRKKATTERIKREKLEKRFLAIAEREERGHRKLAEKKKEERLKQLRLQEKLRVKALREGKKKAATERIKREKLEKRFLAIATREEKRHKRLAGKKARETKRLSRR